MLTAAVWCMYAFFGIIPVFEKNNNVAIFAFFPLTAAAILLTIYINQG